MLRTFRTLRNRLFPRKVTEPEKISEPSDSLDCSLDGKTIPPSRFYGFSSVDGHGERSNSAHIVDRRTDTPIGGRPGGWTLASSSSLPAANNGRAGLADLASENLTSLTYPNLFSSLKEALAEIDTEEAKRHRNSLQAHYNKLAGNSLIDLLLLLPAYRANLLRVSNGSAFADSPERNDRQRQALQQDENAVATTIKWIWEHEEQRARVLSLQGESAKSVLDLVQDILDGDLRSYRTSKLATLPIEATDLRRPMYSLLRALCQSSRQLPSSIFITGVQLPDLSHRQDWGGFGDIYRGTRYGEKVALKTIKLYESDTKETLMEKKWEFIRETIIWRQLFHPYVLPFLGVSEQCFASKDILCLVTPWMRNGTVKGYVKSNSSISTSEIDRLILETAQGIAYLHAQDIVHGDLRGDNILVDDGHHAQIADLGLSVFAGIQMDSSKGRGHPRWLATELVSAEVNFERTVLSDVFSFVSTIMELYTGHPPFWDVCKIDHQVLAAVHLGGRRSARPKPPGRAMSDTLWEIVQQGWSRDPNERPHIKQIVTVLMRGMDVADIWSLVTDVIVYKNILRCLQEALPSSESTMSKSATSQIRELLIDMTSQADVTALAKAQYYRGKLTNIATMLGVPEAEIRRELQSDEVQILKLATDIIQSASKRRHVLALENGDASAFLDVIRTVRTKSFDPAATPFLRESGRDREWLQRKSLEFLINVCCKMEVLPSSFFLEGVEWPRSIPVRKTGYTDTYMGTYNGERVALGAMHSRPKTCIQDIIYRSQLKHPNVVEFLGTTAGSIPNFFSVGTVCAWMGHVDLRQYVSGADHRTSSLLPIKVLLLGIAEAVAYIHSEGFVHGDLTGESIFITQDRAHPVQLYVEAPSLTGLAFRTSDEHYGSGATQSQLGGSIRWMAPELLSGNHENMATSRAIDLYAFGCVCIEALTGRIPFWDLRNDWAVLLQVMGGKRPRRPTTQECEGKDLPENLWELITQCWETNPERRPTMNAVIEALEGM